MEKGFDLKNQFRYKNPPDMISIGEAASKLCVDTRFSGHILIKNLTHNNFNDKIVDKVRCMKLNRYPPRSEHATAR